VEDGRGRSLAFGMHKTACLIEIDPVMDPTAEDFFLPLFECVSFVEVKITEDHVQRSDQGSSHFDTPNQVPHLEQEEAGKENKKDDPDKSFTVDWCGVGAIHDRIHDRVIG